MTPYRALKVTSTEWTVFAPSEDTSGYLLVEEEIGTVRLLDGQFCAWCLSGWTSGAPFILRDGRGPFPTLLDAAKALIANHLEKISARGDKK